MICLKIVEQGYTGSGRFLPLNAVVKKPNLMVAYKFIAFFVPYIRKPHR